MSTTPKLAVISGFDSQFKWGGQIAKKFYAEGYSVDFFCPTVRANQITDQQLRSYGIMFPIHWVTKTELFESLRLLEYDIILFSLPAGLTEEGTLSLRRTFTRAARGFPQNRATRRRPVIVAGFVGVNYENRIGSVVARRLADIVLANSDEERAYFEDVAERLDLKHPRFVTSGLGLIDSHPDEQAHAHDVGPNPRILFAAQPTVPKTKVEKVYLLVRLRQLALNHPGWQIVIKPRHRPNEATFHKDEHHLEELYDHFFVPEDTPKNFKFDYTAITDQLKRTDLMLTVSSTAALEAYAHGVPFGILSDFGVKEPYGASFFAECGALTSFAELEKAKWPRVDPEWAARNIAYSNENFDAVLDAVRTLQAEQRQRGEMLPFASSSYDTARREAIDFIEQWRATARKVAWINKLTSGYVRPEPRTRATVAARLATMRRKTRKLVRDPVRFVKDSRFLR